MHEAIRRQEVAVRATLNSVRESLAALPTPTADGRVLVVGVGTSFHAALAVANSGTEAFAGRRWVEAASSFDVLAAPNRFRGVSLAVALSASGDTWVTREATRWLRAQGSKVLLITSEDPTPMDPEADAVFRTRHAQEPSWTHTVSFTTAALGGRALLQGWANSSPTEADDRVVTDAIGEVVAMEPKIVELTESTAVAGRILLLGSADAEPAAREAALKLREATGRFCATAGVEEALHGLLPSLNKETAVFALTATELERRRAEQVLRAVRELGASGVLVDSSGGPSGPNVLTLPPVPADAGAVLLALPFQILAYWIAVADGRNPDVMGLDDPLQVAARRTFGI